jgi:hypothetical protein
MTFKNSAKKRFFALHVMYATFKNDKTKANLVKLLTSFQLKWESILLSTEPKQKIFITGPSFFHCNLKSLEKGQS